MDNQQSGTPLWHVSGPSHQGPCRDIALAAGQCWSMLVKVCSRCNDQDDALGVFEDVSELRLGDVTRNSHQMQFEFKFDKGMSKNRTSGGG